MQRSGPRSISDAPRLIDVAAAAGVSVSTASEVLRNREGSWIGKATRARVLDAAKLLNYRPNQFARGLRNRSTRLLGMLFPGMTNHYVTTLAEAIYRRCHAAGWRVLLSPLTSDDAADHAEAAQSLLEMQVEGLFVLSPYRPWTAAGLSTSSTGSTATVLIDTHAGAGDAAGSASVTIDRARGVRSAVEHLLKTGRRRVMAVMDVADPADGRALPGLDKLKGWRAALRAAGKAAPSHLIERVPFGEATVDDGIALGRRLLQDGRLRSVDAVVCCDDMLAIGLVQSLTAAGVVVPQQVAVVGFSDQPACVVPPIRQASVAISTERVATAALTQMTQLRANGKPGAPSRVSARFVHRESAGY